ncbi:MAG TPA: hypothetical protein VLV50_19210 [Stellaceae bacterium]|nr:hypothetical protein [Stellaceae bacterium]
MIRCLGLAAAGLAASVVAAAAQGAPTVYDPNNSLRRPCGIGLGLPGARRLFRA